MLSSKQTSFSKNFRPKLFDQTPGPGHYNVHGLRSSTKNHMLIHGWDG